MIDFIDLPNVTLVAASSIRIDDTIYALERSMEGIRFHSAMLVSHKKPSRLPDSIQFASCDQLNSIDDYSRFMLFDLSKFINTDYALIVQYDGYVLRPQKWSDEFFKYDYIGAPWPEGAHSNGDLEIRVGNGGFSLRSKKLLDVMNSHQLLFTDNGTGFYNEDGVLCNYHRKKLEDLGIKFPTAEVAAMFSHESICKETVSEPFGFHRNKR
jgi:hypothetical protein